MKHQPGSIMATTLHMPTFILGIVVLLYLASFVVFAVIRIVTGVSIQRLGYLSLRRISYEPKDGIKIEIRKLGLIFRRPTYSQPAWLSFVISDSQITVDLRKKAGTQDGEDLQAGKNQRRGERDAKNKPQKTEDTGEESKKRKMWDALQKFRSLLNRARKLVRYIRLVDVVITNAALVVTDVGTINIGSTTIMADTRREVVDRSRLFDHCVNLEPQQNPVEIKFSTKSVLFTPDGKESHEILDHCIVHAYGVLESGLEGVKDSAMAVKLGRMSIPYDVIMDCLQKYKAMRDGGSRKPSKRNLAKSLGVLMEEMAMPGSRTERMAEAVMEWKELLRSLLEGIKEIQFAIGHLVICKEVRSVQPAGKPLLVNIMMKELGMDIYRLDQKSPAHLMYALCVPPLRFS